MCTHVNICVDLQKHFSNLHLRLLSQNITPQTDAIHQFVHGSELAARRQRRDRHRIRMTIQKKSPSWRLEQWVRKLKCSGSTGTQLESFPDIRVGHP